MSFGRFEDEIIPLFVPERKEILVEIGENDAFAALNSRLAIIRDRVRAVAERSDNGFYLFGRAGTSKTYTVIKTLEETGTPHYHHVGSITQIGLLDLLGDLPTHVVVLDDVGQIFADKKAVQLLLAALGNSADRRQPRIIKYRRDKQDRTISFTGGIIFISNQCLSTTPLLDAIKSRVHYLQYAPTDEQVAALMYHVIAKGWPTNDPELSPDECREVADYVIAEFTRLGGHLDMRQLLDKALPHYLRCRQHRAESHWTTLVTSSIAEHCIELRYSTSGGPSRREQKESEYEIIRQLMAEHSTTTDQAKGWQEQTGKSERAFFRRLKEMN